MSDKLDLILQRLAKLEQIEIELKDLKKEQQTTNERLSNVESAQQETNEHLQSIESTLNATKEMVAAMTEDVTMLNEKVDDLANGQEAIVQELFNHKKDIILLKKAK